MNIIEKLRKRLEQFEKAQEWADLVQILVQLNTELEAVNIFDVHFKDILSKRLCTI